MPSRSPPIADGWPRGAVPPPFGANPPPFGANPPPFGSMPPPFGAMPPPFGAPFYAELRPGAPRFDARAAAIHGLDQGKLAAEGLSQRASCEALAAWVAARTKPRTKPSFVGHNAERLAPAFGPPHKLTLHVGADPHTAIASDAEVHVNG